MDHILKKYNYKLSEHVIEPSNFFKFYYQSFPNKSLLKIKFIDYFSLDNRKSILNLDISNNFNYNPDQNHVNFSFKNYSSMGYSNKDDIAKIEKQENKINFETNIKSPINIKRSSYYTNNLFLDFKTKSIEAYNLHKTSMLTSYPNEQSNL